jgi:hypothetical protein
VFELKLPANSWVVKNLRQLNAPVVIQQNSNFLAQADYAMQSLADNHTLTPEYENELMSVAQSYCKHLTYRLHVVGGFSKPD